MVGLEAGGEAVEIAFLDINFALHFHVAPPTALQLSW